MTGIHCFVADESPSTYEGTRVIMLPKRQVFVTKWKVTHATYSKKELRM